MNVIDRKKHWETVFQTKDTNKVSWYQPFPEVSLNLVEKLKLPKSARIIEVGSGDSYLADYLLEKGYSEITLLDISEKAISKVKERLAGKTGKIQFLVQDVTDSEIPGTFELWHDRAVFHFLTDENDISKYVLNTTSKLVEGGYLILSTFSENGPNMCSGLNVRRYSAKELERIFDQRYTLIESFNYDHITPSGSVQNFIYCVFQKNKY